MLAWLQSSLDLRQNNIHVHDIFNIQMSVLRLHTSARVNRFVSGWRNSTYTAREGET